MAFSSIAFLAGLAIVFFQTDIVRAECLDGWTYFRESCYFFGHQDLDFQEAERFCTHYGAHLVTIETQAEDHFIRSFLSDLKDPKHWIGLTDEIIEGVWKWYTGNVDATFTNWSNGQPNDGKRANCAAIWASHNYHWVDESCYNRFKPLCEMPLVRSQVVGR